MSEELKLYNGAQVAVLLLPDGTREATKDCIQAKLEKLGMGVIFERNTMTLHIPKWLLYSQSLLALGAQIGEIVASSYEYKHSMARKQAIMHNWGLIDHDESALDEGCTPPEQEEWFND